jgi:riboflavin kinase/FMN adenylyltransferase
VFIVGHDFAFGKDARGNFEYLEQVAPQYGLEVRQVPPVIIQGERVSSTLIRERVLQGELENVELFLGRKYSIVGTVTTGRGMGSKLGFPTANVEPHNSAVPAHGVYVAEALLDGQRYRAAVNIGIAPTIRHEDIMIEAHLLDFSGDIVGKRIEIVFHKRLRPEKKYATLDELIAAIAEDVAEVRSFFEGTA